MIAQITVDGGGPVTVPLLTVYGDGRVITAVDGMWLDGIVFDFELQEFFEEVRSVGLLRNELVLRGPEDDETPDIRVDLAVDGRELTHELDLFRIERPTQPRAFLQRAATDNYFELTEPYSPDDGWLVCTDESTCSIETDQVGAEDRPVLPHEDVAALASEAGAGGA